MKGGKMDNERGIKENSDPSALNFRSRPLTASSGIKNGVRFFTTAMSALDRIECLLEEIEQTKSLVHQMITEFSVIGSGPVKIPTRLISDGRCTCKKKHSAEKKESKETGCDAPRIDLPRRSKAKRNKTLLEICKQLEKRNSRIFESK
ncbi:uncharacterized protein LOC114977543 [Acropora millepora]|uniref:uncharacterized protein LOC114977543 n=1 Tax=Acropora millepora TaxID=45264 RepID=UPI001CF41B2B|nr:uncharacterized protein LOC114977543 [Acropora millepora]